MSDARADSAIMGVVRWQVLIPIRGDGAGKSRLRDSVVDLELHAQLVRAIQQDALHAVITARHLAATATDPAAQRISGIHVVSAPNLTDLPPGVDLLAEVGGGLNAALGHGAADLSRRHRDDAIITLVADLPSLRPEDFLAVLAAAAQVQRGFVADAEGTGTTMLTARPGARLDPSFGPGSAQAHRDSGAVELAAAGGARCDVDTMSDLLRCVELGVGERTAALSPLLHPFPGCGHD
jgi:2-phospho-L-lactate/phosphoenolpyruvate guanylyltransferase